MQSTISDSHCLPHRLLQCLSYLFFSPLMKHEADELRSATQSSPADGVHLC